MAQVITSKDKNQKNHLALLKKSMQKEQNNSAEQGDPNILTISTLESSSIIKAFHEEKPAHLQFMQKYLTTPCDNYKQRHYCDKYRGCWQYHMPQQKRRAPISNSTLVYSDILCPAVARQEQCTLGDNCGFCHNFEELSYHPARFKSVLCNLQNCRGVDICAQAHSNDDKRKCNKIYKYHPQYSYSKYEEEEEEDISGNASTNASPSLFPEEDENLLYDPNIQGQINSVNEQKNHLNLAQFKVSKCKNPNRHSAKHCSYQHCWRDQRRYPVNQSTQVCENAINAFNKNQDLNCNNNEQCNKCHNKVEQLYHPSLYKMRFCESAYTNKICDYDIFCSFAHDENDIRLELIHKLNFDVQFFKNKYKTVWCPFTYEHISHECVYSHNFQEFRRDIDQIDQESDLCESWQRNKWIYTQSEGECSQGALCKYSHGWNEHQQHPNKQDDYIAKDLSNGSKHKYQHKQSYNDSEFASNESYTNDMSNDEDQTNENPQYFAYDNNGEKNNESINSFKSGVICDEELNIRNRAQSMEEKSYNKNSKEKIENDKLSIDDINLESCSIKKELQSAKKIISGNNEFNLITT